MLPTSPVGEGFVVGLNVSPSSRPPPWPLAVLIKHPWLAQDPQPLALSPPHCPTAPLFLVADRSMAGES